MASSRRKKIRVGDLVAYNRAEGAEERGRCYELSSEGQYIFNLGTQLGIYIGGQDVDNWRTIVVDGSIVHILEMEIVPVV